MTSYYQVAGTCRSHLGDKTGQALTVIGIHGMPFKPWNGVKGLASFQFGGYCTHSSVLFVPWHRPYLALFEVSTPRSPPSRGDAHTV